VTITRQEEILKMMHGERATYETIKSWALAAHYDFCRDTGLVSRRPYLEVLGRIEYEFENTFDLPVEKLMLCVVQLVLTGGWYPDAEKNYRRAIQDQIAQYGLEKLLSDVPQEEANLFRHDLNILKLI
jgi:hypothetical protein